MSMERWTRRNRARSSGRSRLGHRPSVMPMVWRVKNRGVDMDWKLIVGLGIFIFFCVLPAVLMRASLGRRLILFSACVCTGLALWFGTWHWAPLAGMLGNIFLLVVPMIFIGVVLFSQHGRRRSIGTSMLIAVTILAVYTVTAIRLSHASDSWEAVTDLPSYLQGQSWVRDSLNDPDSAHFRSLRFNQHQGRWYLCGEVNARNRMGGLVGFTGFYVGVSDVLHQVKFNSDTDGFDDFMRHCYGDDWDKPYNPPTAQASP